MWTFGPLGFLNPWLLLGLIALPIIWILLRAVPPAPIRRRFPGVALLLGLTDDETQTDRTPWWLLLLRLLALAAVIVGFAHPVWNPQPERAGDGPLLVVLDGTWVDARDWPRRIERVEALLDEAARAERPVAITTLTDLDGGAPQFQAAEAWARRLPGVAPLAWSPEPEAVVAWAEGLSGSFDTFWLSDGLDAEWRGDVLATLQARGAVTVFESARPVLGALPPGYADGEITVPVRRADPTGPMTVTIEAHGLDPAGNERVLAAFPASFEAGSGEAAAVFDLPPELRNRITRFEVQGVRSAGAVTLADDALKRREVALIAGQEDREGLELLDPLHFLRQALVPSADIVDGTLGDVLLANPDVIVLADVATLAEGEAEDVLAWVEEGGLLLRFAGPRLAASDVSRRQEDPLMPVRLREGGRTVGGAMSWGEPKALDDFAEGSPFFGLEVPADVTVRAQVLAQPDPQLADRVIAQLSDGTPLMTRKAVGQGQVVLVHVTANAEWSSLPLSGLFVQMLERLAVSTRPVRPSAEDLEGTVWQAEDVLDAFGRLDDAGVLPGVDGERIADDPPGARMPPGLYAGEDRRIAVNVLRADAALAATSWPADVPVEGMAAERSVDLKGWLLGLAIVLFVIDALASLWLSGKLRGPRSNAVAGGLIAALFAGFAWQAEAQEAEGVPEDVLALEATTEVVLAHVLTGNDEVDEIAAAGLLGLSNVLWQRTSVEPALPIAVDLERDEIAFFPMLYWPVTADMPTPSREAYGKLNRYLRSGGMIVFDTRDADTARFGSASPEGRRLQALARPLDIPPLEPIPPDHVLTRTFYLLQDFPGRYASRDVWVEAAPPDAEAIEGMPFRNLNDNVTPVIIGGNNWAAAWAVGPSGAPLLPVGRGTAGERQREYARRFGVNLVMHVLTGNYKSDQVHVPALLDRLGQ